MNIPRPAHMVKEIMPNFSGHLDFKYLNDHGLCIND